MWELLCGGAEEVAEAVIEMNRGGGAGNGGVAVRDGQGDSSMFTRRILQPGRIVLTQPANPDQVDSQVLQRLLQIVISDRGVNGGVKLANQLVIVCSIRVLAREKFSGIGQLCVQGSEDCSVAALRR